VFVNVYGQARQHARVLYARAGQAGQGERRESATDVRLDGAEMAADADDGDAGHFSRTYITIDRRPSGNLAANPPELHVRRIDVLDGVSEVEVAILSEVGEPDLHSVRDNRDAHTRTEVVEALPKAGRPCDEQSKFRTRTVDVAEPSAPSE
jgi:hypothetical protein